MNARDLSEPPNGTTSGCPPPSQHHNYRGLLHTQQRNRFGRVPAVCFWVGVAQITRRCDRAFSASHCFISVFFNSLICPEIVARAGLVPAFPSSSAICAESNCQNGLYRRQDGPITHHAPVESRRERRRCRHLRRRTARMRSITLCGLDHKQALQAKSRGKLASSARRRRDCENPYFTGLKRIQISRDNIGNNVACDESRHVSR